MTRALSYLVVLGSLLGTAPAAGQVVESTPNPARTDRSVTITFHADRGNKGLEDCNCDVYAHTGLITSKSSDDSDWRYVMDEWPQNRPKTKLEKVGENTYELTIDDIREYYSDNRTGFGEVPPKSQEQIQKLAFVFRNSDGSLQGKTENGGDIFVEVNDVGSGEPFVAANITEPDSDPPLYPFMTATDTTVTISVSADTANVDSLEALRLFVDGTKVGSTTSTSLSYDLTMDTPNRYQIRTEAEAATGDSTIVDSVSTRLIRTPNVVDQARPPGVEDGINYNSDGSVTLSLYAPNKDFVYAIGGFTNWQIDSDYFMKRHQAGPDSTHWWITLDNLNSGQEYAFQYFVDGEHRVGDPFSHKVLSPQDQYLDPQSLGFDDPLKPYPGDKTENLVSVLEPGQEDDFTFSQFTPPKRSNLVIYELLLRDFLETSSYAALTDTLDYLDRLGVNAIELMPIANFGGNSSWGYNPNFHLAPDKAYGPPEDLKQFVEAAHQRGIAVILDVVYNHVTDQSPLAQLYGSNLKNPFLEPEPGEDPTADRGFCDDFFRELNHGSPFIKQYIDRANEYWIEEFNVDGFRFDLAKCVADDGVTIGQPGYSDAVVSGWKNVADHVWDNVDEDTHMILEFFGAPSEENELGGYRDDDGDRGSFMTWHNMNPSYSQVDMGYEENSGLSDSYYGSRSGYDQPSFIAYMESHDEQWLMRKKKAFGNSSGSYNTQDFETALNRQKLTGALYFTIPGPRMTWQFSEVGYGWGTNECLKEDSGGGGACPPSAPGRTAPKPVRWAYADSTQHPGRDRLYDAWSALINLRNRTEVFSSLQTTVSMKMGGGDLTRRIVLEHDSMDAVVIANADVESRELRPSFPSTGTWYDFFTGRKISIESTEQNEPLSMRPGEFHVYTSEPVATPESGLVPFDAAAPPPSPPSNLTTSFSDDGTVVTLSWSASASDDITGYRIYRGTTAGFDTTGAHIATVGAQATSYNDSTVTQGSVYYYRVAARDNDGLQSAPTTAVQALQYPETVSVTASRSFGGGEKSSDYRLIALPGQVDRGIGRTFDGDAGDTWQAYWDDGSSKDYLQKYDGSSTFRFRAGRGFWAISDSSWSVREEFSTVPLQRAGGRQVATIPLHQGWNIISNPLDVDVSWGLVRLANKGTIQPLWRFDGSFRQASTFASAKTGEAFYFHNQSGKAVLKIPYTTAGTDGRAPASRKAADEMLTVTAKGPEGTTSTVRMGVSADATDGVGAEDVIAPTTQFEALGLHVQASDTEAGARAHSLARSVRAADDHAGEVYELFLRADAKGPVRLSVGTEGTDLGPELRLVNRETGASYDPTRSPSVTVTPSADGASWALLAGSSTFVEKETSRLRPESLKLWPTYPNPFRRRATVEYTLPKAGPVTVTVYDLLGRRVRVLQDGRQEAGLHRVQWNGRGGSGSAAASGVYIVRVKAAGTTQSRKMTLVR